MINFKIDKTWEKELSAEFEKGYFKEIKKTLLSELSSWITIYPELDDIFSAFNKTPFDQVKVVILWQDPYHWRWQAHWLSFSVPDWVKLPPSLRNIFKELEYDTWLELPKSWNLSKRSEQWVLLLNSFLTVRASQAWSHKNIGREIFTDKVISVISQQKENVVFILWWEFAKSKKGLIDNDKHLIIQSSHPSPFSANKWFFWSKPFSQTNEYLRSKNIETISWSL